MRHIARFSFVAAGLLLAVGAFSLPAQADTESVSGCTGCNGYSFQATLTSTGAGKYHLSYTITNLSGGSSTAQSWAMKLFGGQSKITSFSNFTVTEGNTTNTSAYSLIGKCSAYVSGAMCVTSNGTRKPFTISKGQSVTYSFDFTCSNCSGLSAWNFLAAGACAPHTGTCFAFTASGKKVGVPEPSVFALLASELLCMSGIVLLFRPTRSRILRRWATLFRLQPRPTS